MGIPADLLRRRPDIRAAELAALVQSEQIGIAESQLYPRSTLPEHLAAPPARPGSQSGQIFTSTGVAYAGGAAFQWNVLNCGQITNNVRLQDATLQQLLASDFTTALTAEQNLFQTQSNFAMVRANVPGADGRAR